MPWVQFTGDFDWRVGTRTTAYKTGMVQLVKQACRDAAVSAGRAVDADRPAGALVTVISAPRRDMAELPRIRKGRHGGRHGGE